MFHLIGHFMSLKLGAADQKVVSVVLEDSNSRVIYFIVSHFN